MFRPHGDEKASLFARLDRHRDAILRKLEGLDDEALRLADDPIQEPACSGIVEHLSGRRVRLNHGSGKRRIQMTLKRYSIAIVIFLFLCYY